MRTPGLLATLIIDFKCHMKESSGFSMEKNRFLSSWSSAKAALLSANRLASSVSGTPLPSGCKACAIRGYRLQLRVLSLHVYQVPFVPSF